MTTPPLLRRCLVVLSLCFSALAIQADDSAALTALATADDGRIAATVAADPVRLGAIFSDQLHYAHSNGKVDNKASLIDSLVTKQSIYVAAEYKSREFTVIAPGVALMKGRALVKAGSKDMINLIDLNYLAVWRQEGGQWRFVAWQSCRNGPPTPLGPPGNLQAGLKAP